MTEFENLFRLCKEQYPTVPDVALEHVIKDYLNNPSIYDEMMVGKTEIPKAKVRDTQEDINLLAYNIKHAEGKHEDVISEQ